MLNFDPRCDMRTDCDAPVRRIDRKGWLYCDQHGKQRLAAGLGGRLLTASERDTLAAGKPLRSYQGN